MAGWTSDRGAWRGESDVIGARLLLLVGLLILLAGIAAWVLLRTSREDEEIAARLEAVALTGRPKLLVALPSITKRDAKRVWSWKDSLAGLFGFKLAKTDQYPLAWPWVIVISLVGGRIAVALGSGLFGPLAWILMPVATLALSRATFSSMIGKRMDRLRKQFPDAIGLIVRAVRVGVPVTEALRVVGREMAAPTAAEFEMLAEQIGIGTPLDTALREMSVRNGLPEYGFFAAALSLQAQTGGGLAETLELLAEVTRKRVAMQARGHALSSEARTSSMILGGLPVISGGAIYLINPAYVGILFWDESGRMILGLAILMLLTGMFVMRLIIRSALST